ncbi:MAG: hypothetical protein NXI20_01260 [bacterium]|nr:hypothetical protein [bacterium]
MKKLVLPLCLILVFNLTSCEEDDVSNISGDTNFVIGDNALLGMSRDEFELRAISVIDDELELHVSYSGGCEDHAFSLRWDGTWTTEDDVPVTYVYIDHENKNDGCEAYLSETRTLKVDEIINDQLADNAIIKFINSADQDRVIYYSKSYEWVEQWSACGLEFELEEALCGWGSWGNLWFNISDEEGGRQYLQPIIVPEGTSTPLLGKYRIGFKFMYGYRFEAGATCFAYPGPWMPVEITCIERVL